MSDRIAIFSQGRIEQVGAPAEVYERPATAFVAGSWAPPTCSRARSPARYPGDRHGHGPPGEIRPRGTRRSRATGLGRGDGRVRDVVYLGSDTRYLVTLDAGGELEVIKQNVTTSSMEVLALKGQQVRLVWDRQHRFPSPWIRSPPGRPRYRLVRVERRSTQESRRRSHGNHQSSPGGPDRGPRPRIGPRAVGDGRPVLQLPCRCRKAP